MALLTTIKLIPPDTIEGSPDKVRQNFGGYYTFITSSETNEEMYEYVASVADTEGYPQTVDYSDNSLFLRSHLGSVTTASYGVFNTNLSINFVLVGNGSDNGGEILNDEHWNKIITGGTYNTSSYEGVVTYGIFENFYADVSLPYNLGFVKNTVSSSYPDYSCVNIGYQYNYHEKEYENYINDKLTYEIPNLYLLNAAYEDKISDIETQTESFIKLEGLVDSDSLKDLFNVSASHLPPAVEAKFKQKYPNTDWESRTGNYKKYLSAYQNASFSGSTTDFLSKNYRNIIVDSATLQRISDPILNAVPFYANVSIPSTSHAPGPINDLIAQHDLQGLFMKTIKERFVDNQGTVEKHKFNKWRTGLARDSDGPIADYNSVRSVNYRSIDLLPTMLNDIQSPTRRMRNFVYLTDSAIEQHIVTDLSGTYRHIKNTRMMGFVADLVQHMQTQYGSDPADTLYTKVSGSSLSDILDWAKESNHVESIGYKIQKVGGTRASGPASLETLCNYFIFDEDGGTIDLYDTQVKYDHSYLYNVYQYVAMIGYRYSYENFGLTRQIGTNESNKNCLEFYSAATGQAIEKIDGRPPFKLTNGVLYTPLGTTFASDAQVLCEHYKYLCEFDLVIEPYIKIVEIPMIQKNVEITDHPPRPIEIVSYQRKDDSQTIGFYATYESFLDLPYPSTITAEDLLLKSRYMLSNNLYEGEKISHHSTRPTGIEIYRTTTKPTSLRDFRDKLIVTKYLTNTSDTPYTDCFYEEQIKTNTKYYYLFRFLNAHNMPGRISPVIEAQLVDDGGYKYSLFNLVNDNEITDEPPVDAPSKSFKKLLQLKLAGAQMVLNDENVDYESPAVDQISNFTIGTADNLVWDKTYKVRLTSKKTGRKLDINVLYKYNT